MTDQGNLPNGNTINPVTFQEAPASWTTHYIDPSGFECQLTLRAVNGSDLLKKAGVALSSLAASGCTPAAAPSANGKNQDRPTVMVCEFHNAEMKKYEKGGQVWFSHKLADGAYCKGKARKRKTYITGRQDLLAESG
jgi:hypothetical protein